MKNEFVPYEEALAIEESGGVGFSFGSWYQGDNEPYISIEEESYNDTELKYLCPALLYQQAFRWFRDEYNLLHTINIDLSDNLEDKVYIYTIENHLGSVVDRSEEFKTYEEAELACLRKLIEIVDL